MGDIAAAVAAAAAQPGRLAALQSSLQCACRALAPPWDPGHEAPGWAAAGDGREPQRTGEPGADMDAVGFFATLLAVLRARLPPPEGGGAAAGGVCAGGA